MEPLQIFFTIFMTAFFLFPFFTWFIFNFKPTLHRQIPKWRTIFKTLIISWIFAISFLLMLIFVPV